MHGDQVHTFNVLGGALKEEGQTSLRNHVAGVVAGSAIHAQANIDALVQQVAHRCNACRTGASQQLAGSYQ